MVRTIPQFLIDAIEEEENPSTTPVKAPSQWKPIMRESNVDDIRAQRARQFGGHPSDETVRRHQAEALDRGQTEGDPFERAVAVAGSRAAGNAQILLNPFVESNRPHIDKIREQEQTIQELLGHTTDPQQQRELQRVLSVTQDRASGRSTDPNELYGDVFNPQAENIARWAAKNNVSQARVNAAMKRLQASQAARTGISQYTMQKARQAQLQAQQLEQAKQAAPDLAPFMHIDPETNAPTVDKNAADARISLQNMALEQQQSQQEFQAKRLEAADKNSEAAIDRLYASLGMSKEAPSMLDITRMNDEAVAAGGKAVDPQQILNQHYAQLQNVMRLENVIKRQHYGSFLSEEELDKRFPLTGIEPSAFEGLSQNAQQLLGITTKKAVQIEPIPEGMSLEEFARARDVFLVRNKAQLERLMERGLVGEGDPVATPQGIVPAMKQRPE